MHEPDYRSESPIYVNIPSVRGPQAQKSLTDDHLEVENTDKCKSRVDVPYRRLDVTLQSPTLSLAKEWDEVQKELQALKSLTDDYLEVEKAHKRKSPVYVNVPYHCSTADLKSPTPSRSRECGEVQIETQTQKSLTDDQLDVENLHMSESPVYVNVPHRRLDVTLKSPIPSLSRERDEVPSESHIYVNITHSQADTAPENPKVVKPSVQYNIKHSSPILMDKSKKQTNKAAKAPRLPKSAVPVGPMKMIMLKREVAVQKATDFINKRLVALMSSNSMDHCLMTMYKFMSKSLNYKMALHVCVVSHFESDAEKMKDKEDDLKKNYIKLISKPEWSITLPNHPEFVDHPGFPKFYELKLKSDYMYIAKKDEHFMKMYSNLKVKLNEMKSKKSRQDFRDMLYFLKINFDENIARDLLALQICSDKPKVAATIEEYLMCKYGFKTTNLKPIDFNRSWSNFNDIEVSKHQFFLEYFVTSNELKNHYSLKNVYKPGALEWIKHRLSINKSGTETLPKIVKAMYKMLEHQLNGRRAHDIFLLSQSRMDQGKLKRMEAYLSEKYRRHISNPNLEGVFAAYTPESKDNFSRMYPVYHDIIKRSQALHPVYTIEMYKNAVSNLKRLLEDPRGNKEKQLYKFMMNNMNECRVREILAFMYDEAGDWEGALFNKYKKEIKAHKASKHRDYWTLPTYQNYKI